MLKKHDNDIHAQTRERPFGKNTDHAIQVIDNEPVLKDFYQEILVFGCSENLKGNRPMCVVFKTYFLNVLVNFFLLFVLHL